MTNWNGCKTVLLRLFIKQYRPFIYDPSMNTSHTQNYILWDDFVGSKYDFFTTINQVDPSMNLDEISMFLHNNSTLMPLVFNAKHARPVHYINDILKPLYNGVVLDILNPLVNSSIVTVTPPVAINYVPNRKIIRCNELHNIRNNTRKANNLINNGRKVLMGGKTIKHIPVHRNHRYSRRFTRRILYKDIRWTKRKISRNPK
jgi:hypothetical protein